MKILRIKLENIKSYEDGPIIDLHQGVNFISGKNGSGKTTLLESIGYGIFDYCNYSNISKMLREGTKSGKITIWFSFDDDIIYRSERKINFSSSAWTIYEESDETEIVSGSKETLAWIKEKMGMPEEVNISQMYSDIIGVSQGEITTYFKLSSEAKRKEHFNPMIGVEDYKKAFSQTSSLPNNIKSQIQEIVSQIAQINARTEKYSENKDKLEKIKKELSRIQKDVGEKKKAFETKQKELKDKDGIRDELKELEKNFGIIQEDLKNKEVQKKKTDESLSEAKKAQSIITQSLLGYKAYIEANKKLELEEERESIKVELEERKNELTSDKKTLEKDIEVSKKNNQGNEKKINDDIKSENKKIQLVKPEYEKNSKKLNEINDEIILIDGIKDEYLEELNDTFSNIKENMSKIKDNESLINKKNEKIKILRKQVSKPTNLKKIEENIRELNKKIKQHQARQDVVTDKIKSYRGNITKGGFCPILNEPCKKVSKDILNKKIEELNSEFEKIQKLIQPLNDQLEELGRQRDLDIRIQSKGEKTEEQIEEELEEIKSLKENNKNLKSEIKPSEINQTIKQIKDNFGKLKVSIKITEIKDEKNIVENLTKIIIYLKTNINDIEKKTNKYRTEIEKIKTNNETVINKSEERIDDLNNELSGLEVLKNRVKKKEKDLGIILNSLKEINKKLEPLSEVTNEIKKLKGIRDKNTKNYENYQKNIRESENVDKLTGQLKQIIEYIGKNIKKRDSMYENVLRLNKGFNEEDYRNLKENVDKLREEKTKLESKLIEFEKDNKELIKLIAEMEAELKKIKKLEEDKDKLNETSQLIDLIRKILNEVGKPIAQRYLDSLSASANMIYNTLSDEKVILTWESDYVIRLTDLKGTREFTQLSGGEQMCAALSVQLALAREFSSVGIAIFDEPTSNLDENRRDFLSDTISNVKEEYGFNQLFIISHDETFSSLTEQEIHLEKINGKTTLA